MQRYPGLFDVSRALSVAVLNCSTRYIDLRAARWRSDLATHTPYVSLAADHLHAKQVASDPRESSRPRLAKSPGSKIN